YDVIFSIRYGILFERTEVRSFSRSEEGTAVEVALIFNGTSSETLPSTDNVAETLIRAVTDPNSTLTTQFNVTVVVDSIRVLTPTSTTPEVPATGSPTVPTQVLILQATLEVPFVPALENSQSTEYQELATTVIGFCDVIFSIRYGILFERTEVRSFSRREEGTAVEVALIFNGTSSETLPSTDDVAETLIRAVTDPDSTLTTQFNVTVVVDSIRVLTPTPTTPEVPITGSPTVPTQVLILQATLEVPFVPALENSQSTEYQELATTVIGFYDVIFSIRYGILFERTEVRSFSRSEEGTAVEVALIFNGTSSETLPSTDDVAETLIRAVTDPDSTLTTQFNVTVVVDSIRVLTPTPTTPEVPITGSPTVPTQVLILQATLEVPFVPALENSQSTEYQELATTVIGFYDVIFSIRYGILFERTEVRSFSRREEGTAVEVALIFNGTSSETLPSTDDVAETLIRAVTDPIHVNNSVQCYCGG
ncbi:mucin-2-like, partial [Anguilla rostrata]|uniref:mucin-2-like n=1 Tax=Anguilla rostrata TaxID=7938 RepID=UPI0030D540CD